MSLQTFAQPPRAPAETFLRDVLDGLSRGQKTLPCKYFYDARGSALFDRICQLEEYYPTRCETEILRRHAAEMAQLLGPQFALIEYGSGSSLKTRLLLDELADAAAYVPVDISGEHLLHSARRLVRAFPGLVVLPACADFTESFELPSLPEATQRKVVFFSGSTIGNFQPSRAVRLLARIARQVGPGGGLLIGVDLKKDPRILDRAYNDASGVTAAFNLNLLVRINRELGADFALERFRHHAFYNAERGRVEMHLVSLTPQTVHIGDTAFFFAASETICTEYSYKFSPDDFDRLATQAGFAGQHAWTDPDGLYSVCYLEARAERSPPSQSC